MGHHINAADVYARAVKCSQTKPPVTKYLNFPPAFRGVWYINECTGVVCLGASGRDDITACNISAVGIFRCPTVGTWRTVWRYAVIPGGTILTCGITVRTVNIRPTGQTLWTIVAVFRLVVASICITVDCTEPIQHGTICHIQRVWIFVIIIVFNADLIKRRISIFKSIVACTICATIIKCVACHAISASIKITVIVYNTACYDCVARYYDKNCHNKTTDQTNGFYLFKRYCF